MYYGPIYFTLFAPFNIIALRNSSFNIYTTFYTPYSPSTNPYATERTTNT